ncbi:5' exonuclease Apollo [Rhizophlyctis rosea]|uniref:5' exonuclease Apollo n=1 Tax=Rhizophlyctis rosea TaxID=64517 RepID=A0AAD5SA68_9FUNG|nr:5' exonuclease Apollo [Rhizophlyctis rosea]
MGRPKPRTVQNQTRGYFNAKLQFDPYRRFTDEYQTEGKFSKSNNAVLAATPVAGHHTHGLKLVAAKCMNNEWGEPGVQKLARQEFEMGLKASACTDLVVKHVELYYGQFRDVIVMEFAPRGDLWMWRKEYTDENTQIIPEGLLWKLLHDMSTCLAFLHAHGIVHGDIKAANILRCDNGSKICDFGISFELPNVFKDKSNSSNGTITYKSPERLRAPQWNAAADVWAVGAILYDPSTLGRRFMPDYLCGEPFFTNENYETYTADQMAYLPEYYSAQWCTVLHSMLEENPDKRPTAADLSRWSAEFVPEKERHYLPEGLPGLTNTPPLWDVEERYPAYRMRPWTPFESLRYQEVRLNGSANGGPPGLPETDKVRLRREVERRVVEVLEGEREGVRLEIVEDARRHLTKLRKGDEKKLKEREAELERKAGEDVERRVEERAAELEKMYKEKEAELEKKYRAKEVDMVGMHVRRMRDTEKEMKRSQSEDLQKLAKQIVDTEKLEAKEQQLLAAFETTVQQQQQKAEEPQPSAVAQTTVQPQAVKNPAPSASIPTAQTTAQRQQNTLKAKWPKHQPAATPASTELATPNLASPALTEANVVAKDVGATPSPAPTTVAAKDVPVGAVVKDEPVAGPSGRETPAPDVSIDTVIDTSRSASKEDFSVDRLGDEEPADTVMKPEPLAEDNPADPVMNPGPSVEIEPTSSVVNPGPSAEDKPADAVMNPEHNSTNSVTTPSTAVGDNFRSVGVAQKKVQDVPIVTAKPLPLKKSAAKAAAKWLTKTRDLVPKKETVVHGVAEAAEALDSGKVEGPTVIETSKAASKEKESERKEEGLDGGVLPSEGVGGVLFGGGGGEGVCGEEGGEVVKGLVDKGKRPVRAVELQRDEVPVEKSEVQPDEMPLEKSEVQQTEVPVEKSEVQQTEMPVEKSEVQQTEVPAEKSEVRQTEMNKAPPTKAAEALDSTIESGILVKKITQRTIHLGVPEDKVRLVIGTKGQTRVNIEQICKALILITQADMAPKMRKVVVQGPETSILKAKMLIAGVVNGPVGIDVGSLAVQMGMTEVKAPKTPEKPDTGTESGIVVKIINPRMMHVGVPEGKRLNRINIEKQSKASVQISIANMAPGLRKVVLKGSEQEMMKAKDLIAEVIKAEQQNYFMRIIPIPAVHVRKVIGNRGEDRKKLQNLCGVTIWVQKEVIGGKQNAEIRGPTDGIERAVKCIEEILATASMHVQKVMRVDGDLALRVFGRDGELLNYVHSECEVTVAVGSKEGPDGKAAVTIRGLPEGVERAEKLIQKILHGGGLSALKASPTVPAAASKASSPVTKAAPPKALTREAKDMVKKAVKWPGKKGSLVEKNAGRSSSSKADTSEVDHTKEPITKDVKEQNTPVVESNAVEQTEQSHPVAPTTQDVKGKGRPIVEAEVESIERESSVAPISEDVKNEDTTEVEPAKAEHTEEQSQGFAPITENVTEMWTSMVDLAPMVVSDEVQHAEKQSQPVAPTSEDVKETGTSMDEHTPMVESNVVERTEEQSQPVASRTEDAMEKDSAEMEPAKVERTEEQSQPVVTIRGNKGKAPKAVKWPTRPAPADGENHVTSKVESPKVERAGTQESRSSHSGFSISPEETRIIKAPADHVGTLIGRGGDIRSGLNRECGVLIDIGKITDENGNRDVSITGTPKVKIEPITKDAKAKNMKAAGWGRKPVGNETLPPLPTSAVKPSDMVKPTEEVFMSGILSATRTNESSHVWCNRLFPSNQLETKTPLTGQHESKLEHVRAQPFLGNEPTKEVSEKEGASVGREEKGRGVAVEAPKVEDDHASAVDGPKNPLTEDFMRMFLRDDQSASEVPLTGEIARETEIDLSSVLAQPESVNEPTGVPLTDELARETEQIHISVLAEYEVEDEPTKEVNGDEGASVGSEEKGRGVVVDAPPEMDEADAPDADVKTGEHLDAILEEFMGVEGPELDLPNGLAGDERELVHGHDSQAEQFGDGSESIMKEGEDQRDLEQVQSSQSDEASPGNGPLDDDMQWDETSTWVLFVTPTVEHFSSPPTLPPTEDSMLPLTPSTSVNYVLMPSRQMPDFTGGGQKLLCWPASSSSETPSNTLPMPLLMKNSVLQSVPSRPIEYFAMPSHQIPRLVLSRQKLLCWPASEDASANEVGADGTSILPDVAESASEGVGALEPEETLGRRENVEQEGGEHALEDVGAPEPEATFDVGAAGTESAGEKEDDNAGLETNHGVHVGAGDGSGGDEVTESTYVPSSEDASELVLNAAPDGEGAVEEEESPGEQVQGVEEGAHDIEESVALVEAAQESGAEIGTTNAPPAGSEDDRHEGEESLAPDEAAQGSPVERNSTDVLPAELESPTTSPTDTKSSSASPDKSNDSSTQDSPSPSPTESGEDGNVGNSLEKGKGKKVALHSPPKAQPMEGSSASSSKPATAQKHDHGTAVAHEVKTSPASKNDTTSAASEKPATSSSVKFDTTKNQDTTKKEDTTNKHDAAEKASTGAYKVKPKTIVYETESFQKNKPLPPEAARKWPSKPDTENDATKGQGAQKKFRTKGRPWVCGGQEEKAKPAGTEAKGTPRGVSSPGSIYEKNRPKPASTKPTDAKKGGMAVTASRAGAEVKSKMDETKPAQGGQKGAQKGGEQGAENIGRRYTRKEKILSGFSKVPWFFKNLLLGVPDKGVII